jgi:hypothetical protein
MKSASFLLKQWKRKDKKLMSYFGYEVRISLTKEETPTYHKYASGI